MSTHLRLLSFLGPYRKQVIFAWVVVAMTAVLTMIGPQLVGYAVDTGLKPPTFKDSGTRLSETITRDDTQITIGDASVVQPGEIIRLGSEEIRVSAIDGDTLTVERGAEGTRVRPHDSGQRVELVDRPNFAGKNSTLAMAAGLIIIVALLRGFFTYWMQFLGEWLSQHVAYDLRNHIYEKLQRLSYAYHDKQQTGQLMSRATQDVEATRMFIQLGALRLLDISLRVLVAAVLMFSTNWMLALVAWSLIPLVAFQSVRIQLQSRKLWMRVQDQLGRLTTVLQENMTGVRVVKAFSREEYENRKFEVEAQELFEWNMRQNRIQAQTNPFYQAMSMLSQVFVLGLGCYFITQGELTYGQVTAFLLYQSLLIMPMRMLGFIVQMFARAGASGERIFEVLDAESAVKEKPDAQPLENVVGRVRFESVSFGYDAISPVLRDVTFEAQAGQVVALLGPTGSGKTTIVNLLPRFYDVSSGRILIDDIDIRDTTLQSLRANIGIIQQDVFMFSATIRENIAYGAVNSTYEQIIEAAKIARIHDFIMSLPDGYDTWVGERGVTLSGGQKQRLSIARTLLLDPRILILDDSTSSVDTQTEYLIQQALAEVMKGRTTLVIAQRLRTVKNADAILVMKDGTIAERGKHEELIALDGLYREIYDLELRDQEEALKRFSDAPLGGPILMGFWGGGGGGWGGGPGGPGGGWGGGMRGGGGLRRAVDAWDDEELGSAYNHDVVVRVLGYVKPYWKNAILATIGVIGAAILLNYQPALIQRGVDAAVEGDTDTIIESTLIFLSFVVVGWGFVLLQLLNTGYVGHRVMQQMRVDMFRHLQKLSLRFYDNNEVGRVMSRVQNDVTSMQELLTNGFLTIFGDILGLAVVVYLVSSRDLELALVTFSVVPVLIAVTFVWQIYARKAFLRVRQAIAIVNSNLQENVSGVRVIQSLSREDVNARRFDALNEDNMRANIDAGRLQAAVMPMVELLSSAATALVILYGGRLVLNGEISLGVLLLFVFSIERFFQPIRELVMQYAQLQRAMAGGVRAFEVLDTEPDIVDAPDAVELHDIQGRVTFDNVSFDYVEGVPVLRDINLDVQPGETIALVGSTGAGKTTLTALILRFYEITSGRILIDGIDLKQINRASLTRRTGVVLQDPFLFSGTVRENILYGRLDATDDEVIEAAKAVGAHDFIMRLDHGYDTELHERGQNLSVGQRQLIGFARAVLARPRILILDEATANVDTRTEVVIQAALRELLRDRTSFVIAHRLSTIREATRILVMDQGRIAEMGSHDELLAQNGIYANLYRMTFEKLEEPTEGVTAD